jgi:hypothetical protein
MAETGPEQAAARKNTAVYSAIANGDHPFQVGVAL